MLPYVYGKDGGKRMTNVETYEQAVYTMKELDKKTGKFDTESQRTVYLGYIAEFLAVIADKLTIIAEKGEKE